RDEIVSVLVVDDALDERLEVLRAAGLIAVSADDPGKYVPTERGLQLRALLLNPGRKFPERQALDRLLERFDVDKVSSALAELGEILSGYDVSPVESPRRADPPTYA